MDANFSASANADDRLNTNPPDLSLRQAAFPPPLPFPPQSFSDNPDHTINFRHPAYPDDFNQNILLTLYAFDHPDGGLHYGTAFLACALVAGNAWNGYFTTTVDGPKVVKEDDQLLREKNYYFHVAEDQQASSSSSPSQSSAYPICPSFEHWRFPHGDLPPSWSPRTTIATASET